LKRKLGHRLPSGAAAVAPALALPSGARSRRSRNCTEQRAAEGEYDDSHNDNAHEDKDDHTSDRSGAKQPDP
jgi:hypothetical protein